MRRLVSLLISGALLVLVYSRLDTGALARSLEDASVGWLLLGMAMVIPLTVLTGWRLQRLIPSGARLSLVDAVRLVLIGATLNMIFPSKLGDVAKAYFVKDRPGFTGVSSLSMVILEKAWDLISLLAWCVIALLLYPADPPSFRILALPVAAATIGAIVLAANPRLVRVPVALADRLTNRRHRSRLGGFAEAWEAACGRFWGDGRVAAAVIASSLAISFLHFLQISIFVIAVGGMLPLWVTLAVAPLAIAVGLVPVTVSGIGTRDAALVLLYRPFLAAPLGAAVGILATTRYLLPALAGLPFVGKSMGKSMIQPGQARNAPTVSK